VAFGGVRRGYLTDMTEPHEDPRIRETEPSTETGGPLDPTTSTLDEMVSTDGDDRARWNVEPVTDSGDAERGEP
jgi:hypothetical protein